ncbi:MAG: hypothetical protein ABIZ49_08340, partial [Opitutaceae bacterium]
MNCRKTLKKLAAATLAFIASGSLFAVVIDFQNLEHNDGVVWSHGNTYTEDGFTLVNLSSPGPFASFGTWFTEYT